MNHPRWHLWAVLALIAALVLIGSAVVAAYSAKPPGPPGQLKRRTTTAARVIATTTTTTLPSTTTTGVPVTNPTIPTWTTPTSDPLWIPPGAINVVTDYGAHTGEVDTTDHIQAAINAATTGQTVYIPAGSYTIGTLVLNGKTDLVLMGAGMAATILNSTANGSASGAVKFTGGTVRDTLRDMKLVGDYAYTDNAGVVFTGTNVDPYILRVAAYDWGFSGFWAPTNAVTTGAVFDRVVANHCADFGVHMKLGTVNATVIDSTFAHFHSRTNPAHAVYYDDVNGGLIARNTADDVDRDENAAKNEVSAFKVTRETDTPNTGIIVEDNTATNSICVVSIPYAKNVIVRRCHGTGITERGYYFLMGGDNIDVDDCDVDGATKGFTLYSTAPTNSSITNSTATNCGNPCDISPSVIPQSGNRWQ